MDGESHLGLCPKVPLFSEPRAIPLAISSLLQPSLSSLCSLKFITVMKWVKQKFVCRKALGSAFVLTSSPPPPNPKSTLPHSLALSIQRLEKQISGSWGRGGGAGNGPPFPLTTDPLTAWFHTWFPAPVHASWGKVLPRTNHNAEDLNDCSFTTSLCVSRTETFCIHLTHRLDAHRSTSLKAVSQDHKRHVCVCQG